MESKSLVASASYLLPTKILFTAKKIVLDPSPPAIEGDAAIFFSRTKYG